MSENRRATSLDRAPQYDAWLILDKTEVVVYVPRREAQNLYDRFRKSGLVCSRLPGPCDADVIDFVSPSADQERLIRTVFHSWHTDGRKSGESAVWCGVLSILVVIIWIVAQLASW